MYRGPAAGEDCPEAAATLVATSSWNFEVEFVGPKERIRLSDVDLQSVDLYVQPGGGHSVQRAYRKVKRHRSKIRRYVGGGGRYLGICMGGYLAAHWRGFGLTPTDADQYITSDHASVTTDRDTVVEVVWRGTRRYMFFQDGPLFETHPVSPGDVLATYASNGMPAALVAPFGTGKVGVCGPHPEASGSWYAEHGLINPDGVRFDLGHDLIDAVMT